MIEYLMLTSLIVLVLLIVQQSSLRAAIVLLGAYSLMSSLVYLHHGAPDVALAEAVIGSTLATVLYLAALRKQEAFLEEISKEEAKPKYKRPKSVYYQRILSALICFGLTAISIYLIVKNSGYIVSDDLRKYYLQNFSPQTSAGNSVAAIYLQYRLFDTIFETLTLMISVMAVIYFSRYQLPHNRETIEDKSIGLKHSRDNEMLLTAPIIKLLYPFIIILATYIILFGHDAPGGGFQGGAVLSALIIMRYILMPVNDMRVQLMQTLEKAAFAVILLAAVSAGMYFSTEFTGIARTAYFIFMNIVIGLKVCLGISIIFIRFVFYESR
jgi:multicomponent Na+:H+ antiporter subunit B